MGGWEERGRVGGQREIGRVGERENGRSEGEGGDPEKEEVGRVTVDSCNDA